VEEVRKIKKNLSYDSRFAGRDLSPGLPEYKTRVLLAPAQKSSESSKKNLFVLKADQINKLHVGIQYKISYPQSPL
jgi:hypothetical protein